MIKVEAATLQEAYSKAASELSCSVVDLEINILQNGSNGFLGMFKKSAIIEVQRKGSQREQQKEHKAKKEFNQPHKQEVLSEVEPLSDEKRSEKSRRNKNRRNRNKNKDSIKTPEGVEKRLDAVESKEVSQPRNEPKKEVIAPKPVVNEMKHTLASATTIDQNFHLEKRDINDVVAEVSIEVKNLFKYSCFSLDVPIVSKYNDDTILIEFAGEDAALLIGKEGYRYKALSYLLYNWINLKYGLNIRLEIAEFLKNQEEMIQKYLLPVMERIRNSGRGQTKILDGVLIKIALEALREQFPEKYVGIKSGKEGGKFIVVNDFNRKNA
ncbi:MAG: Jag N-terminal domain-containing protein [Sulfurospirillaceae bacterium]|nr:Jag N-terminal domain-containing protein [Sulfurospirillaceae bacterium]